MAGQDRQADKIRKEFKDKAGKETRPLDPDAARAERRRRPGGGQGLDVREELRKQADDNPGSLHRACRARRRGHPPALARASTA